MKYQFEFVTPSSSSSSSAFALAWRNYLPGGIILQGVLLLQGFAWHYGRHELME
jgi:hypothetical protein